MFHVHLALSPAKADGAEAAAAALLGLPAAGGADPSAPPPPHQRLIGRVHLFRRAFDDNTGAVPAAAATAPTIAAPPQLATALPTPSSSSPSPHRLLILCLPSTVAVSQLLSLSPSSTSSLSSAMEVMDAVHGMRSLLLDFASAASASSFYRSMNGRAFHPSTSTVERCHTFHVHSTSIAIDDEAGAGWSSSASAGYVELPRCPRCLLRLDTSCTGIVPSFDLHDHLAAAPSAPTTALSGRLGRRRSGRSVSPPPPSALLSRASALSPSRAPSSSSPSFSLPLDQLPSGDTREGGREGWERHPPPDPLTSTAPVSTAMSIGSPQRPRSSSDDRTARSGRRKGKGSAGPLKRKPHLPKPRAGAGGQGAKKAATAWADVRCDVCTVLDMSQQQQQLLQLYHPTVSSSSSSASSSPFAVCCSECDVTGAVREAIWLCLVCGHRGCGRYFNGHAAAHYTATSHRYTIELLQHYVWDYHADGFCHRVHGRERDSSSHSLNTAPTTSAPTATGQQHTAPAAAPLCSPPPSSSNSTLIPQVSAIAERESGPAQLLPLSSSVPTRSRYLQGLYDSDAEWEGESDMEDAEGQRLAEDDQPHSTPPQRWLDTEEDGEGGGGTGGLSLDTADTDDEGGEGGGGGWDDDDGGLVAGKLSSIASHYNHLLSSELVKQASFFEELIAERVQLMEEFERRHAEDHRRLLAEVTQAERLLEVAEREVRQRSAQVEERRHRNDAQQDENDFLQQLNASLLADQRQQQRTATQSSSARATGSTHGADPSIASPSIAQHSSSLSPIRTASSATPSAHESRGSVPSPPVPRPLPLQSSTIATSPSSSSLSYRPRVAASLQSKQRQVESLQQRIAALMAEMDKPERGAGSSRGRSRGGGQGR